MELFDCVILINPFENLKAGRKGAIVEKYNDNDFEVEFLMIMVTLLMFIQFLLTILKCIVKHLSISNYQCVNSCAWVILFSTKTPIFILK